MESLGTAELDDVDILLIKALQKDSRQPLNELARLADISVPTARSRLDRLVNLGVIRKFTVAVDPQKLVGGVTAFINLKVRLSDIEMVKNALTSVEEIMSLYVATGESDIILRVCAGRFARPRGVHSEETEQGSRY